MFMQLFSQATLVVPEVDAFPSKASYFTYRLNDSKKLHIVKILLGGKIMSSLIHCQGKNFEQNYYNLKLAV